MCALYLCYNQFGPKNRFGILYRYIYKYILNNQFDMSIEDEYWAEQIASFYDYARGRVSNEIATLEWIDDEEKCPGTGYYRELYQDFRQITESKGFPIHSYLSVGSGLGRHVVIASQSFPELQQITSIDWNTQLHASVQSIGIPIKSLRAFAFDAFEVLAKEEQKFDFICFEHIGDMNALVRKKEKRYDQLASICSPGGFIGVVGDSFLIRDELVSRGIIPIPTQNDSDGWNMRNILWRNMR